MASRKRGARRAGLAVGVAALLVLGLAVWFAAQVVGIGRMAADDDAAVAPATDGAPRRSRARRAVEGDVDPPATAPLVAELANAARCATISGRVFLFGHPVAGAEVAVVSVRPRVAGAAAVACPAPTRTGADGSFAVTVAGDAKALVAARDADGRSVSLVLDLPPGALVRTELDLPDGPFAIRGRATTVSGAPWRGLVGAMEENPWRMSMFVPVDAEGRFAIAGLCRGRVTLHAQPAGAPDTDPALEGPVIDVPRLGDVSWVVDDALRLITGTVRALETGEPVAGAAVRLSAWGTTGSASGVTAADGTYRIELRGRAYMRVTAPGFAPASADIAEDASSHDIGLVPGCKVRGAVVSADDGVPAAGAIVLLGFAGAEARHVRAGPDGRFEIGDLPAESVHLHVAGGGWHSTTGNVITHRFTTAPERPVEVTLPVVRSARLTGRVLDPAGNPVAGAAVQLTEGCTYYGGDGRPLSPCTDAAGRFAFEDCQPSMGEHEFLHVVASGLLARSCEVPLLRPGVTEDVEVRLEPAREVVVNVTGVGGAPLAGVRLEMLGNRNGTRVRHTDARGTAIFRGLAAWDCVVVASAPGWGTTEWAEDGDPPSGRIHVTLARGGTVTGIVLDVDGSPAAGIDVGLRREGGQVLGPRAKTGPDGRFVLDDVGPGAWIARAWRGMWDVEQPCAAGGDLAFRLRVPAEKQPHVLTVRVLGPDARPVARFWTRWGDASLSSDHASEARDGVARIMIPDYSEAVIGPDPRIEISAWGARDAAGRRLSFGPGIVALKKPWPDEVTITLPRGVVVEGRVLRTGGNAAAGVNVRAGVHRMIYGGEPIVWVAETESGPEGWFRFDTLPNEPMRLRAVESIGDRRRVADANVAGASSGVELVLGE